MMSRVKQKRLNKLRNDHLYTQWECYMCSDRSRVYRKAPYNTAYDTTYKDTQYEFCFDCSFVLRREYEERYNNRLPMQSEVDAFRDSRWKPLVIENKE